MIIDELVAVLGFDVKGEENLRRFNDGLKRVEASLGGFVSRIADFGRKAALGITAIGAGIGATVYGMVKMASAAAKPLDDMLKFSKRVGGSFEGLQEWQYAAGLAGASSSEFQTSVQSMTRQLAEAARGTGRAKKALADYGLSATTVNGKVKESTQFLFELSDKFQKLSDAKQLDLASKMGLSPAMLSLLKGGREEIEKAQKAARDSGLRGGAGF